MTRLKWIALAAAVAVIVAAGIVRAGDVSTWSTAADSNNTAAPDGFPEAMSAGGVNSGAREVMAAVRRYIIDRDPYTLATGTAETYALAATQTIASLSTGMSFSFLAPFGATGSVSLNVDSLGAKTIMKHGGTPLASGDIRIGQMVTVAYSGSGDVFMMLSQLGQ